MRIVLMLALVMVIAVNVAKTEEPASFKPGGMRGANPLPLVVDVTPGPWKLPDGKIVNLTRTRLIIGRPDLFNYEDVTVVPQNRDQISDSWDPWHSDPGNKGWPGAMPLGPRRNPRDNTLLLGHLYRAVIPGSVVIQTRDGEKTFVLGEDYVLHPEWSQFAALNGRLGEQGSPTLKTSISYVMQRIDLIQLSPDGKLSVKRGQSETVCPMLPEPDPNHIALAGVYIAPWKQDRELLVEDDIFPLMPWAPPEPLNCRATAAIEKLKAGQEVKIAFVGASISVGAEAGAWWADLWTEKNLGFPSRLVTALRRQYPEATITPLTAFEGATTLPKGIESYMQKLHAQKPDVVIIDYGTNDAHGPVGGAMSNPPEKFKEQMLDFAKRIQENGGEPIIITPSPPAPWLKNKQAERIVDFRSVIIDIGQTNNIAVADIYQGWMDLAKRGMPPFSQLHNNINHPGTFGHSVYSDALLPFFVE